MIPRKSAAMVGSIALIALMAAPATAQPAIEVVAEGLGSPRGVTVAGDGSIYVAEAGTGGDACTEIQGLGAMCMGPSGNIVRIADGNVERVVQGLPSGGPEGEIGGVSDIAIAEDGSLYYIVNAGGPPDARAVPEMGKLFVLADDGSSVEITDVAAFENTADPDGGAVPDSNPHSIALVEGGVLVADAGGNDLLLVDEAGEVSLVAVLPSREHMMPAELMAMLGGPPPGEMAEGEAPPDGMVPVPAESVPTSVTVGPDGAFYVGELTGFPFPAGGAVVWRVAPGEEPSIYATGLTNILDLAFGPDGTLFVAEMVHEGILPIFMDPEGGAPPIGAVMSVPPDGGEAQVFATGEQLMALGGLDVASDGSIYVSANTMAPGGGTIVKITP